MTGFQAGLLLTSLISLGADADWQQFQRDQLGTRVTVELASATPGRAQECAERVFDEMDRIDKLMSSYRPDSDVSRINQLAAQQAVPVTAEVASLIRKSIQFSQLSQGAFDISYASIGYKYDYRERTQPSAAEIDAALPLIDYRSIAVNDHHVRLERPGMRIDLGGIAKGYAVDLAIAQLQDCGIERAMVSAGGDSFLLGDRDGRQWMIGVQHPRQPDKYALRVPLADTAVSTSGDYERYFLSQGDRIHHIIDPQTGRSSSASWSATVIGPNATTTDALSTTMFVLGAEQGIQLIDSMPQVDAIIIDAQGRVHYSSGLAPPDPSNPDFKAN